MIKLTPINVKTKILRIVIIRTLATNPSYKTKTPDQLQDPDWNTAKPYSAIPGPSKVQLITRNFKGGKYNNLDVTQLFKAFGAEYGKIFKLPGLLGKPDMVGVLDANSIAKVCRTEGIHPIRKGLDTFEYYRYKVRPELFKTGLVTEQGLKWWQVRSAINPIMLKPHIVKTYIPSADDIATDFITKMKLIMNANNEMPANFGDELKKWGFETVSYISLDHRLGVLLDKNPNPEVKKFIDAINHFFNLTYELDYLPSIWKYYKTPKFNLLMSSLEIITEHIMKYVELSMKRIESSPITDENEQSVLQQIFKIDRELAILIAFDLMSAGIDATASSIAGLLYAVATNPEKQEILRKEIFQILPEKTSKLNRDSLSNVPYLRACLKESLRMTPVSPGIVRSTIQEIVVAGYQIPKDTTVVMTSTVLYDDETLFYRSNEFIPERWFKTETSTGQPTNPFAYIPFGFGPRACIGKRFAEMEVMVLMSRMLREFKIEWNYEPLKMRRGLILFPSNDLKFKLTPI